MKKKALALALVLCMVLAMLPVSVFAAPAKEPGSGKMTPTAVGKLEPPTILPNAKSYSVTLTSSGKGEAELLVDSPAKVGSEVYFSANPDDGYLAEIYFEGLSEDDLIYLGADLFGFIMPSNKVKLTVKFVAAQGSDHSISVYENGGVGDYALSRSWAKEYESVLLAVEPYRSGFDPEGFVWVSGAPAYYLFEDEGIYYYEIIMGDESVSIFLCYERSGPFSISTWLDGEQDGSTITLSHERAYVNDLVTVTIKLEPGYQLVQAKAVSYAGDLSFDLTPIGNDQYTFRMHPTGVELHIYIKAQEHNVTVTSGAGGTAYASTSRAKVGSTVTLTCVPNSNYRVYGITGVDGLTETGSNTYAFTMPARDVSISVTYRTIYNPVTVSVENSLGGSAILNVAEAKAGDTVTLTCYPDEGYRVAQITGVSGLTDNGDGTYAFTMPDEAVNLKVLFLRSENPFLDVNETHFFYDSVLWAVEKGITSGLTADTFGPFATCNRAQVVTFLWRYAGSPEPTTTENPFADVPSEGWFTKPVLWALENGITQGVSATEFGPNLACNRAQVVTFLWRMLGQPTPGLTEHPFGDVEAKSWYEAPVLWALENGITTGASSDTFNPNGQCQRAQVVTFLYRTAQLPVFYDVYCEFDAEMGTVELSAESAQAGETVTVVVAPAEGYLVESVSCQDGTDITNVSDTEYTFVMPEQDVVLEIVFAAVPEETTEPDPTEPEPTDPSEPEPTEPVKTYNLDLRTNGNGKFSYVDGKTSAAPGESIFFYAVPNPGYQLTNVGVFNPKNEIDVSQIRLYEHDNDLYELIMIDHELIMTLYFTPIG